MSKELCDSLLKWLQTFDLEAPHSTLDEITDGVALAQALNQIAPEWFSDVWLSKIKPDSGNWRLKVSNLKKIVEAIMDYYQECFNQPLSEFGKPDVNKIGGQADTTELGRLLQLILGCAVNCNHKQDYITRIMSLEESVQRVIMQSIQELEMLHGHGSFSASLNLDSLPQMQQLLAELQTITEARDQMGQRCLELDMQVSLLQEEKASLLEEKKRLTERLQESVDDPIKGTGQFRRQIESLKEEIFKLETSRDDYRLKLEMQEKEMVELQSKLDALQQTAGEARYLKDEVDILRETADKVVKYESTIQSYKKKLEELGDLKREVKMLEGKNMSYIEQNMELEKELKKSSTWKTQVDVYKKQVAELHQKFNEETKTVDKLEFENKKLQEQLKALKREKECLINERDLLKESNEELKCCQLQSKRVDTSLVDASQGDPITEYIASTAELKQKLLDLQQENKKLRYNQESSEDEQLSILQVLLEDKLQQLNQKQVENRQLNHRIIELEAELKDMTEKGDDGVSALKNNVIDLQNKLQVEKEQRAADIEERESELLGKKQMIIILQETVNRKEMELQEADDKIKKYIEKAKDVYKNMDQKHNTPNTELNILRGQVIEKDKIINQMEKEYEKNKNFKDREERLVTSAFYNLTQSKQRESVDQRLSTLNLGQSQSFLVRQRQSTSRRMPLSHNTK
uniref:Protein hook n=2 Tax=Clastoptera arizonana TaxID=38151 RepID=A0A1B6DZC8_9HEMI